MSQEKPKGPVMVIGGGIAGIQAALSLADAGYGVCLIERTGSLGGMIPSFTGFIHSVHAAKSIHELPPANRTPISV
jgi:heterodisulfide reductase subunit A-like polyferredoxin